MTPQVLQETIKLTCSHLSIDTSLISTQPSNKEDLVALLKPVISNLLDNDMSRLLNLLYRIDVDENKAKSILASEAPDLVAVSLSRLIIDREILKVQTRLKYQSNS